MTPATTKAAVEGKLEEIETVFSESYYGVCGIFTATEVFYPIPLIGTDDLLISTHAPNDNNSATNWLYIHEGNVYTFNDTGNIGYVTPYGKFPYLVFGNGYRYNVLTKQSTNVSWNMGSSYHRHSVSNNFRYIYILPYRSYGSYKRLDRDSLANGYSAMVTNDIVADSGITLASDKLPEFPNISVSDTGLVIRTYISSSIILGWLDYSSNKISPLSTIINVESVQLSIEHNNVTYVIAQISSGMIYLKTSGKTIISTREESIKRNLSVFDKGTGRAVFSDGTYIDLYTFIDTGALNKLEGDIRNVVGTNSYSFHGFTPYFIVTYFDKNDSLTAKSIIDITTMKKVYTDVRYDSYQTRSSYPVNRLIDPVCLVDKLLFLGSGRYIPRNNPKHPVHFKQHS